MWRKGALSVIIVSLVLALVPAAVSARSEGHGHWGYSGRTGPAHWGDLSPKFRACSEGRSQSPIDVRPSGKRTETKIEFHYRPTRIRIINNGHAVQVNYDGGSYMLVDGTRYDLLQFHFHAPSEHTVKGSHYPLEMHLVHKNKKGGLAVIGVLFREGDTNPALSKVWKYLPEEEGKEEVVEAKVNVLDILPSDRAFYSYSGSLTTPPCSEGVAWFIMKNPVTVSKEDIEAFRKTLGFENNRPVQPLNGRAILESSL